MISLHSLQPRQAKRLDMPVLDLGDSKCSPNCWEWAEIPISRQIIRLLFYAQLCELAPIALLKYLSSKRTQPRVSGAHVISPLGSENNWRILIFQLFPTSGTPVNKQHFAFRLLFNSLSSEVQAELFHHMILFYKTIPHNSPFYL